MADMKAKILEMKQKSAERALAQVKNGMVIGIGSGSTVREFIKLLSTSDLDVQSITCIASSVDTEKLLIEHNLRVGLLNQYPNLDLTIDGADRVDDNLHLIKGGGAALLREKIIAAAAKEVIIIVDDTKLVPTLGGSFPVPVEVIPHARAFVTEKLIALNGKPVIRSATKKLGPIITDNGNIILDTDFALIPDPTKLEQEINNIPGVMENGLFPNKLVSKVIIASATGIEIKEK